MPTQGFAGSYAGQLGSSVHGGQLYLDPGNYNLNGPGGADAGAFQGSVQMPPALTWISPSTTVVRSAGVTVNGPAARPTALSASSVFRREPLPPG